jgi:hypothetical protein
VVGNGNLGVKSNALRIKKSTIHYFFHYHIVSQAALIP